MTISVASKFLVTVRILINMVKSIYIVKLKKFDYMLSFLEKKPRNEDINTSVNIKNIINIEKKLSSLLKVNKCLIRCGCIHMSLKDYGFESKLIIGICTDDAFLSHSWIEAQEKVFIFKDNKFKKILEIK